MQNFANKKPLVSLIISTLGRDKQLKILFQSLNRQEYKNFEVIVVDQNDDERLIPIIGSSLWEFPIKRISATKQRGLSKGRNLGIAHAKGEVFLFPDDDCWYPMWFIQKGIELLNYYNCSIVTGRAADEKTGRSINGRFEKKSKRVVKKNIWTTQIEWVAFFRKEAINAVDGYNEDIGIGCSSPWQACEGQDITLRMLERGFKAYYDPLLYGFHEEINIDKLDTKVIAKARGYARGLGYVLHHHKFSVIDLVFWLLRPAIRSLISYSKARNAQGRYYFHIMLGRYEGWREKIL